LDNIYVITSMSEINTLPYLTNWYEPYYLHLSLIIMSVGFLFKISAAPFHFWSPDVYDGIPTIVTTYVAIVAKYLFLPFF
jgi:NADH-ubiquinone oxidoreductase chain 2